MPFLSFFQILPDVVRQPTVIAALASLGIHGLLAVSLPTLSASSTPEEENMRGTVKVVELTPAQQNRLPQPSSLPPLAYQTQPLPPEPPLPYGSLPLPPANLSSNIPIIRLPPAIRSQSAPRTSRLNQTSFLRRVPETTRSRSQTQASRNYRVLDKPILRGKQFSIAKVETPNSQKPQQDKNRAQPSTVSGTQSVVKPNNSDILLAEKLNAQRQTAGNIAPQTQISKNTNSQQPTQGSSSQQAALEQQRQQQLLADIRQRQQDLTRDETGTKDEDARQNYVDLSVKQGITQKPEEINISGSYPQEACIQKLEGTPVIGVSVDANNNVSESRVIKSSGYPIFNKKALEDVVKLVKFNNTGQPKTYLVYVQYEYSSKICPSLTVPQASGAG
ncbi:MAG: TonB family protein [Aphanothece sp. CMT-3BRIN-NPC111]|nr:TonB family protein [Aphanothece sp. CMT-3BRIN-NPC111]